MPTTSGSCECHQNRIKARMVAYYITQYPVHPDHYAAANSIACILLSVFIIWVTLLSVLWCKTCSWIYWILIPFFWVWICMCCLTTPTANPPPAVVARSIVVLDTRAPNCSHQESEKALSDAQASIATTWRAHEGESKIDVESPAFRDV